MATSRKSELVLTCNATAIKDVMKFLNSEMDKLIKKRDALLAKGEQNWSDKERSQFKKWGDDIAAITSMQQKNREEMVKFGQVMKDLANSKLRDLKKALNEGKNALNKMSEKDPNRQKLIDDLAKLKNQIATIGGSRRSIDEINKDLKDLSNVRMDHLIADLETVRAKYSQLSETQRKESYGQSLKGAEKALQAQIGINQYGRAGIGDLSTMNTEQLRAEQQRLRSAYMATQGANGYEQISDEYLTRLQEVNQLLRTSAEEERKLAEAKAATVRENEIVNKLNNQQKVSLDELVEVQKKWQAELQQLSGVNVSQQDQQRIDQVKHNLELVSESIRNVREEIDGIANLDYDNLQDVSTEKLETALKSLEDQEKKLAGTDAATARQMAENKRKVQEQIAKNKRAVQDYANAEKVAGETGKHNVQELQAAYNTLQQKLMSLNTGQKKEIEQTRRQMKQLKVAIDDVSGSVSKQNSIWQTAVRNITAYVGVFGMFNAIKNGIQQVIRGGEELSDQMAQVRMVSGLAMEDIEELTRRLAKLDTRTTLQELTQLSYAGAKLGFGEKGIEGLEEFVSAANQVNVALREDLGDEALSALSKITENMGLIKKMGVEQAMLSTSSAMFKLAASSTAAAGPIVEVTKRLAPVAQMSGFATHEILALASASDSLQLMPEVVGTALSKLIMALQNNHNLIEQFLTIPDGTISSMFKAGQSMDALMLVFDKMKGKNVTELDELWKLLGSDGQRLITVVADMANHTDVLAKHLDISTKAFKEATAVTEEYNIQQETAMAYLLRAENLWRNAFINPDSSLSVKEMTKAWYDFTKSVLDSDLSLSAIKVTIDALLISLRILIQLLPMIAFGLLAKGAALLVSKFQAMKVATDGFITSWKKMDAATKSNWIGLIVGTAIQAVFWIREMARATGDAEKEQKKLNQAIEAMHEKVDEEIYNLSRLKKQIDDTNLSQEDRNKLLSKVRTDYDIYLNYLGIEMNTVDELAKHYDALTKVMRQRFAFQEREEYKRDVMGGEEGLRMKRRNAGAALTKKAKGLGLNLDLDAEVIPMLEAGKSWQDIYKKVNPEGRGRSKTYKGAYSSGIDTDYAETFDKYLLNFVNAWQAERKKEDEINAAFAGEIGDFDYDKWLRTQVKGEFKVQTPKGSGKGDKKGQELKNKFKTAKENAEGLIAKIDEWYNLQEAVINDYAATGQITDKEADEALKAMKIARNTALEKARLAVASGDDTEWKKFYTDQMSQMMIDHGEWSTELFKVITEVDVKTLHDFLSTFDGSEGMKRLDASSFFDSMRKKAAANKKEVNETLAKAREELNKLLLKYEYFDQAARTFANNLVQIGAIGTTAEQMAKGMEGVPDAKQTMDAVRGLLTSVIQSGTSIYAINPGDAQAVADMLRNVTTEAMTEADYLEGKTSGAEAKWLDLFPALKDWMANPEQHKKELEDVFNIMLIAEQDYYKKRKESFQHQKTQLTERFQAAGFTDQEERTDKALASQATQQQNGMGTFWQQNDLGSIANDPEIQQIQNRIYWRNEEMKAAQASLDAMRARHQQELDDLRAKQEAELEAREQTNASEAELDQLRLEHKQQMAKAERELDVERMGAEDLLNDRQTALTEQMEALTSKTVQEMQKRIQAVNKLTKPFADAAGNIGKKFGEMIRGAEEESMTWNEIWKNMLLAVAESVMNMGAQYAQNLIMQKAMNKGLEAEEIAHAGVMVPAGIASGSAKTIGALGWLGLALIPVITSLLMGLLQGALSSSRSGSESSASTSTATPKTKLVSGMLTYDKGNVQRFIGQDGKVYTATEEPQPKDGLVTRPIATTVQGQPALVAERGPEIVIGRETTEAIMMNEPELIRYIANYDRHGGRYGLQAMRAYDSGNVGQMADGGGKMADGGGNPLDADTLAALRMLPTVMNALTEQLKKPVYINKYGTGGLIEEVKSGLKFDKRYNG